MHKLSRGLHVAVRGDEEEDEAEDDGLLGTHSFLRPAVLSSILP